MVGKIRNRKR